MGFGQYSSAGRPRMSKREMMAALAAQGIEPVKSKLSERNTLKYELADGTKVTRLHDTDVVRELPHGEIVINTGGWNTLTTRGRINGAIPGPNAVYTHRGAIFLRAADGKTYEFNRCARLMSNGSVMTDIACGEAVSYDSIRKFVEGYLKKLREIGVPTDLSGDPWVVIGDGGKYSASDVMLWLGNHPDADGPYVFGSFVIQAMRWSGFRDEGIRYWIQQFNEGRGDTRNHVCRTVRRYIRACLGYASS